LKLQFSSHMLIPLSTNTFTASEYISAVLIGKNPL